MREFGHELNLQSSAPIKEGLASFGEKLGRLKLNGRLVSRSPSSTLLELEGLLALAVASRAFWRSVEALSQEETDLDGVLARCRVERLDTALSLLEELHEESAMAALRARPKKLGPVDEGGPPVWEGAPDDDGEPAQARRVCREQAEARSKESARASCASAGRVDSQPIGCSKAKPRRLNSLESAATSSRRSSS